MTRVEREQIIARYLGGEMSTAEEQDFFIRVAVDKELRQDLRAQRTVDSALRKDREAEATGHSAVRVRVAAMLAATPGGTSNIPTESLPFSSTPSTHGLFAFKWLAAVAAGAIVAVAILVLPGVIDSDNDAQRRASASQPTTSAQSTRDTAPQHVVSPSATSSLGGTDAAAAPATANTSSTMQSEPDVDTVTRNSSTAPADSRRAVTRARTNAATSAGTIERTDFDEHALDTSVDASALDRRDATTADDSIDIGIKLRIPKE